MSVCALYGEIDHDNYYLVIHPVSDACTSPRVIFLLHIGNCIYKYQYTRNFFGARV